MLTCMGRSNAGVKRNRLPNGELAVRTPILLSQEATAAYESAARESGQLSTSLYLELLRRHMGGKLPILDPDALMREVRNPAA